MATRSPEALLTRLLDLGWVAEHADAIDRYPAETTPRRMDEAVSDVKTARNGRKGQIPGRPKGPNRDTLWEAGYAHLVAYVESEGHAQPPFDHREDDYRFGSWVSVQRKRYRTGVLQVDRTTQLAALPDWSWDPTGDTFDQNFALYACHTNAPGTPTSVSVIRTRVVDEKGHRHMGKVKSPKSEAGRRAVAIPPHLWPMVSDHLARHCQPGPDGLLLPGSDGEHLAPSSLYGKVTLTNKKGIVTRKGWGFYEARQVAGCDDLRFHDLRHTGAVLAAQTGATFAESMGRQGHATPAAALRYQHVAAERDLEIARRLSTMAGHPGT